MNFTKYFELISVLFTTKKTKKMLLKNHDLRPIESTAIPEIHANTNKSFGQFKGCERRQERSFRKGGNKFDPSNVNNPRK